jgi:hypothetical protein
VPAPVADRMGIATFGKEDEMTLRSSGPVALLPIVAGLFAVAAVVSPGCGSSVSAHPGTTGAAGAGGGGAGDAGRTVDARDGGAGAGDAGRTVDARDGGAPREAGIGGAPADAAPATARPHVFVVAMENHDAASIYGSARAPYINGSLLPAGASAANFVDELPSAPSEPHYIWMEAGTNAFADHTFTTDAAPSASNSTSSTAHLVAQIAAAGGGLDWMSYQEGSDAGCPLDPTGTYLPRHDPFLFFQDVSGDPPSTSNAFCAAHHRPLDRLDADLAAGDVASYVFVTPDLCHNMHGSPDCPSGDLVRMGDDWLSGALPPLIDYVNAHGGAIFLVWDEGSSGTNLPFIALGPQVRPGYRSTVTFDHGSMLKTIERMLGLPPLATVANDSDLGDLFVGGAVP